MRKHEDRNVAETLAMFWSEPHSKQMSNPPNARNTRPRDAKIVLSFKTLTRYRNRKCHLLHSPLYLIQNVIHRELGRFREHSNGDVDKNKR